MPALVVFMVILPTVLGAMFAAPFASGVLASKAVRSWLVVRPAVGDERRSGAHVAGDRAGRQVALEQAR